MTAKELMQSYQSERKEMARLKEQIQELRDLAENTTVDPTREKIQTSGSKDRLGDITARIVDIEAEIMDRIIACLDDLEAVENAIISLSDADERLILQSRYVNGMGWGEISEKYCYGHTAIMDKHHNALEKISESMKERTKTDLKVRYYVCYEKRSKKIQRAPSVCSVF